MILKRGTQIFGGSFPKTPLNLRIKLLSTNIILERKNSNRRMSIEPKKVLTTEQILKTMNPI